ncbi:hypothetical protein HU200_055756 [Digitaria exilis]|uniref:Amino acid transporter transmembrane domain-containing protein n=1 Tax=Digitaria exilis TaxID=1010633 RepID=A0A835ANJ2_9POAL|nr:hypothetical protein HU200_055756 [Digitaria exilis]CAB3476003.1 unnamed protein product [Digitaria exilis]
MVSDEPLLGRYEAGRPEKATSAAGDGDASFVQTCLNGLNALSGVGLLSVPYALSEGGWLSLALLAAVSGVCWYTGILLQRCMSVDPTVRTFADIGERAFGRRGRVLVAGFFHAELYLIAIGFLILDGDNLDKLFPGARVSLLGGHVTLAGKQLFVVLVALAVAPTTWLRSLGVLAYVSATGVFASVLIVLSVLWAAAVDGVGFSAPGATALRPGKLPTALGLFTFCFCGHAVFPTLYTSMKEKRRFPKMLAICFVLCTLNYGSMAVLGYLMYGAGVQSQVTLNLPAGRVSSTIAIVTTIVSPLSKYALVVTPIATAIEERILRRGGAAGSGAVAISVAVRTLLVLSTVAVALAVPFFGYLMALVGSLLSVGACVMLPCVCYLRVFRPPARAAETVAIAAILVLSSVLLVTGTYSSLVQIVHELTA